MSTLSDSRTRTDSTAVCCADPKCVSKITLTAGPFQNLPGGCFPWWVWVVWVPSESPRSTRSTPARCCWAMPKDISRNMEKDIILLLPPPFSPRHVSPSRETSECLFRVLKAKLCPDSCRGNKSHMLTQPMSQSDDWGVPQKQLSHRLVRMLSSIIPELCSSTTCTQHRSPI